MTNQQKIDACEYAIKHVSSGDHGCICVSLAVYYVIVLKIHGSKVEDMFPELVKFKPQNKLMGQHWWNKDEYGRVQRVAVLRKLIAIYSTK